MQFNLLLAAFFFFLNFFGLSNKIEGDLSNDEKKDLLLMREEEKLARDVYNALGERWSVNVFFNIPRSEQMHMNIMQGVLEDYKLEDPVKSDKGGDFTSTEMKKLYNDLMAKGNKSLMDALVVGAIIEDLDLRDLQHAIARTDKQDIKDAYEILARGSRNHLRAFYRNIVNRGGSYTPKYISQKEFDAIVNGQQETGRGGRRGNGWRGDQCYPWTSDTSCGENVKIFPELF